MNPPPQFEAVIGLEVHAQLRTASKAFCGCSTHFGDEPNTNVCPVCLGLPGALPVLNRAVVASAIRMGLAVGSAIAPRSIFARKNYFYPDLPKGYQISQYDEPICLGGAIEIDLDDGTRHRVRLTRIHMEEDAGKSIHDAGDGTLVDVNRSGVPLIEIVSEPDLRTAREAALYVQKVRQIVTYLGICDGNMEEGSLRCDANVSVRPAGSTLLGTKTEVKNMNSFRNVERAIAFEIARQTALLHSGGAVLQETLLWDADNGTAHPMRSKEEADDYRYFPEPDLVPVHAGQEWVTELRRDLPEHPTDRRDRFEKAFGLPRYDADVLTAERGTAEYFESVLRELGPSGPGAAKPVSNWVMTDVLRVVGERKIDIDAFPVPPSSLAGMIRLIAEGTISGKIAKEVFAAMLETGQGPDQIVKERGLVQLSDEGAIGAVIDEVLARNAAQAERYRAGNEQLLGYFVGEVMKQTKGKANPQVVNTLLKHKLT